MEENVQEIKTNEELYTEPISDLNIDNGTTIKNENEQKNILDTLTPLQKLEYEIEELCIAKSTMQYHQDILKELQRHAEREYQIKKYDLYLFNTDRLKRIEIEKLQQERVRIENER